MIFISFSFFLSAALIQHDQIKSEILKQNALQLFIDGYEHFNHRSKRLILEALGSITFDKEAARLLRHNTKFIDSVRDIQATADVGLKKAAERIIWNLINGIGENYLKNLILILFRTGEREKGRGRTN